MSEINNEESFEKFSYRNLNLLDAINTNLLLMGACSIISVILLALILWRVW